MMRWRTTLAVLGLGLLGAGAAAAAHPRAEEAARQPRRAADVARAEAARRPRLAEHSVAAGLREPVIAVPSGVANVVAHVPAGKDARAPIHLVLYFHGAVQCAAQIAQLGDVECRRGSPRFPGYGFDVRHDAAGTDSVFVIPQFAYFGGGSPGRMGERGYFRRFLRELLAETLAPGLGGPRSLEDVATITLIGHSAGFAPIVAILDSAEPDIDAKIANVVNLDGLYAGGGPAYTRWLLRGSPSERRRFVYVQSTWGDGAGAGAAIARSVRDRLRVAVDPTEPLSVALRDASVVVTRSDIDHYWMPLIVVTKLLEALGLPKRAREDPLAPAEGPQVDADSLLHARALRVGEPVQGALEEGDLPLRSGAVADDYALDVAAGTPVTLTVRGGRSRTETCCRLDTVLRVLGPVQAGGEPEVVAEDDDGEHDGFPSFASRLTFTAPRAGRYLVRVTSHGPWRKLGPYMLTASAR